MNCLIVGRSWTRCTQDIQLNYIFNYVSTEHIFSKCTKDLKLIKDKFHMRGIRWLDGDVIYKTGLQHMGFFNWLLFIMMYDIYCHINTIEWNFIYIAPPQVGVYSGQHCRLGIVGDNSTGLSCTSPSEGERVLFRGCQFSHVGLGRQMVWVRIKEAISVYSEQPSLTGGGGLVHQLSPVYNAVLNSLLRCLNPHSQLSPGDL